MCWHVSVCWRRNITAQYSANNLPHFWQRKRILSPHAMESLMRILGESTGTPGIRASSVACICWNMHMLRNNFSYFRVTLFVCNRGYFGCSFLREKKMFSLRSQFFSLQKYISLRNQHQNAKRTRWQNNSFLNTSVLKPFLSSVDSVRASGIVWNLCSVV